MTQERVLTRAREILQLEINAITKIRDTLGPEFLQAIDILKACQGKIVLTGMGKSGSIAKKASSTFCSTGTAAVFLHPAEGAHGDLGVITPTDVVIAICHSGNTFEVISLLPYLKELGVPVIAIVGRADSMLKTKADVTILTGIDFEVDSHNLAPTASSISSLAICDALAIILSEAKHFKLEDFAQRHPGGIIGRRLSQKVSDLMHAGKDNPMLEEEAPIELVIEELSAKKLGGVSIVRNHKLVGIITDGDIRRALLRKAEFFGLKAQDIMTQNPVHATADMMAITALELMERRKSQISVLPVVDPDGNAVGMLRLHDLLHYL